MTGVRCCRSVIRLCLFVFSLTVVEVRFGIAEPLSRREPRQVIYADSVLASLDNDNDDEVTREVPVGVEHLLPSIPYPGDLSSFFRTASEPQTTTTTISLKLSQDGVARRRKRGAYLRDEDDRRTYSTRRGLSQQQQQPSDFSGVESRLMEVYQADESNLQEMSFNGAGYLRSNSYDSDMQRVSQSFNPPPENRRAAHDFQVAFHPGRSRGTSFRDGGSSKHSAPRPDPKYVEALDPAIHGLSPVPPAPQREPRTQQQQPEQTSEVFNAFSQHYQSVPELNSFFYKQQQPRTEEPKTEPVTDDKKPSLENHRMDQSATQELRVVMTKSGKMVSGTSKKDPDTKKQKTGRRRRSVSPDRNAHHHDQGPGDDDDGDTAASASSHSDETRGSTRYSIPEDHQDSGSGFIPLTGTFNGGTIHFSLPYYGSAGPVSPSYSSGPPVGYNSYAPARHYGGGGGGGPEYYPHSEARRYSYGMLGSGNFEVIRGGLFPEKKPQVLGGFDGGRSHYAPAEVFNGFGGATEIIIDGPIQGFQGFDNFPAHLINALSKRSEVVVGRPPVL